MKTKPYNYRGVLLSACTLTFMLSAVSLFLFSFTVKHLATDFLKQLGINQVTADTKISSTMLEGSFNTDGIKNMKSIPVLLRTAMAKEALTYTKQYVSSALFVKQYHEMKKSKKPIANTIKTPEEMQKETVAQYQKGVLDMEELVRKAAAQYKSMFQKSLDDAKKQLKEAEDTNNKMYVGYRKNYETILQNQQQGHAKLLQEWEQNYPSNHLIFIKQRLAHFLQETENIDFAATTVLKNGKLVFTDLENEKKSMRWKMSYRAGKEVVAISRTFVQQWYHEIL